MDAHDDHFQFSTFALNNTYQYNNYYTSMQKQYVDKQSNTCAHIHSSATYNYNWHIILHHHQPIKLAIIVSSVIILSLSGSPAQLQHLLCLALFDEVNSAWLPDKRYAGLSSGSLRPAVT